MSARGQGILTLAYYFDPAGAVGALRPCRFHRYLGELGFDSHVITAIPPPSHGAEVTVVPDEGEAFWERRTADRAAGRAPEPMPLAQHMERLLRKTVWPGMHGLSWSRAAARRAAALIRANPRLMVLLSTYPPLGTHLAALDIVRKVPVRWIADFRDPVGYGDSVLSRNGIGMTEKLVFRRADAIVANTELAAARWRERYPWALDKIHVIWNGYDPENDASALPVPERSQRWLVHAGNLYASRNANIIVAGLARLRAARAAGSDNIRVVLAGPYDETAGIDQGLHKAAAAEGWLDMPGLSLPRQEAQRLTREASGLLLLQPQSRVQVPAKLYEYLLIGRPILALVPRESSVEWILNNAGVPFVCIYSSDDANTVDGKLRSYLAMPNTAAAANEWFRTTFDPRRQTSQLARIIEQLPAPVSGQ